MQVSDQSIPDFAQLLVKALERLHQEGLKPFSLLEALTVGHITSLELKPEDALGDRITYEIDYLRLPKFVALVTWLNPFGMVSHHPKLILRIARYLLGYTTQEEEEQLPSKLRADMGV